MYDPPRYSPACRASSGATQLDGSDNSYQQQAPAQQLLTTAAVQLLATVGTQTQSVTDTVSHRHSQSQSQTQAQWDTDTVSHRHSQPQTQSVTVTDTGTVTVTVTVTALVLHGLNGPCRGPTHPAAVTSSLTAVVAGTSGPPSCRGAGGGRG